MSQEDIIKYLEKEMITNLKEMNEHMESSQITIQKAMGKLVNHGEVIRFNIGSRCFYCLPIENNFTNSNISISQLNLNPNLNPKQKNIQ